MIELGGQRQFLAVGDQVKGPALEIRAWDAVLAVPRFARGKRALGGVVVAQRQPELLHVVGTLRSPRRLAGRLDRRQQHRDQDADDREYANSIHAHFALGLHDIDFSLSECGGAHVVMTDGSVHFLNDSTKLDLLQRMANRLDGLPMDPF
tara:strand:- start:37 stop:486 length:450 start_codon:yes stop_codon:yes gene_type:complete